MTDKVQKIREEVERLYNQSLVDENRQADRGLEHAANVSYGKSKACKQLISFIDSLQEKPVSEELEEACEQLAENARKHKAETSSPFFSQTDYRQGVIDGAKWQKEQMIEEKASMSCALEWYDGFVLNFTEEQLNDVVAKNNINIGDKVKVIVIKED